MLNQLINKLTASLGSEIDLEQEKIAVANYGLQTMVYNFLAFLVVIVVAGILGVADVAIAAYGSAALFRNFSGGAHCSKPLKCFILTSLIFPILALLAVTLTPYLSNYFLYSVICVACGGLISAYFWAPVDTETKPITSPRHQKQLKILSIATVLLITTVLIIFKNKFPELVVAGELGLLWQSLMLWPFSVVLIKKYDHLNFKKGRR